MMTKGKLKIKNKKNNYIYYLLKKYLFNKIRQIFIFIIF